MQAGSLAGALEGTNPVEFLRSNYGRHPYPVPDEFTNWIDEQRSWTETCGLSDLSHHQRDFTVEGPDAVALFRDTGINDFSGFSPGQAKQFVACNPTGYVIGDGILFFLSPERLRLTGTPIASHWVQYRLEQGDYDAIAHVEERYHDKEIPHDTYRYQVQGPKAQSLMETVTDQPMPNIPFFNFRTLLIDGHEVNVLNHSMARQPGYELWGPWDHAPDILEALLESGDEYGLRRIGEKAYKAPKGGDWIPRPLPAIFCPELEEYRNWLPADAYEGISTLGGSYDSSSIEDYYLDPIELGYERFIDWDRDFTGRESLANRTDDDRGEKVTLVWDPESIRSLMESLFEEARPYKWFDLSSPFWSVFHYDEVRDADETIGVSKYFGYSANERAVLSLALLDSEFATEGETVDVVWGEPGGCSNNPAVEPHTQTTIEARVAPAPFVEGK